ncbi:MAG: DUF5916 domain-containing protein [Gemmatimonadaceae bacterium]
MLRSTFSAGRLGSAVAVTCLTIAPPLRAMTQQYSPAAPAPAVATVKRAEAVRAERGGSLRLDGKLDDAIWHNAQFIAGFTQREPNEGQPATDSTSIAFVYDDDALYIGARLYSKDPSGIRALVTRRDREGSSEQLLISFDTFRDRRTAYTFGVTAGGVRIDYLHTADFEFRRDYTFDPVWEAKTAIDSLGWTAEMRIPFSQLRFSAADEQLWGVNAVRLVPARNESAYWMLVRRNDTGWASRMGDLVGIRGVRPSRRLEILPYVATDARFASAVNPGNPFDARRRSEFRAGGDVKFGLGPNATLDATFNPDFGQVEADPAEVNLSAFETFFPERRPFFTEGTQLLSERGGMFYSRRIGAPPPLRPGTTYSDIPRNSTILGAAKVSGRLPSKLSFAGLTAVTDREDARTFDAARSTFGRALAAPRTFFGAAALQQEVGRDASTFSGMLTAVERDLDSGSPAARVLVRRAYAGGMDGRLRWNRGQYDVSAFLIFSYVQGDSQAIAAQQTSSRRYYQRPDADHVDFDPSRTSLFGYFGGINHSKMSGKHWLWDIDFVMESPGLEFNDIGRLGSADDRGVFANIRYRETQRGRLFHNYEVGIFQASEWNFGSVRQFTEAGVNGNATFKNFWRAHGGFGINPASTSDNLTRGGPLMGTHAGRYMYGGMSSRAGARTGLSINVSHGQGDDGGRSISANTALSLRPAPQWELTLQPAYNGGTSARQYVTSLANGGAATFGRRYVFAYVDRDQYSMRMRLNYALTPNLTLETYAEPFAASGRFRDYGELPAPRERDLRAYGTDGTTISQPDSLGRRRVTDGTVSFTLPNGDFNVRSFRSNAVLRWEWRPGSTLFLVWQQDRFISKPNGAAVNPSGLWDALSADGTQFLALKVSYWLPIN